MLLGIRSDLARSGWKWSGGVDFGSGFETQAGRWTSFDAGAARIWDRSNMRFELASRGYGLRYTEPFEYQTYWLDLLPSASLGSAHTRITLAPRLAVGSWSTTEADGTLTVPGVTIALAGNVGTWTSQAAVEMHVAATDTLDERFSGVGFDVATSVSSFDLAAGVKLWRTPLGTEWGYSAVAARTIAGNLVVIAQLTRAVTDPVLGSPASFGASIGASWRMVSGERKAQRPVAAVGPASVNGKRVRFTITHATATSAAVSGSFSNWTPIPMQRAGSTFTVEVTVPRGTHQYGFLLNGTDWFVAASAGGLVDDGFGRKNATLVIEGE